MTETYTLTQSKTYVHARASVIDDHFELFLRCADMDEKRVERLLESAHNQELEAVGIYISEGGKRTAEVEFNIDWEKHKEIVKIKGEYFDTYLPGWKNGTAPEAYVAAGNLVKVARKLNTPIYSWIRVSSFIRSDPKKHKLICDRLGYSYSSAPPSWRYPPNENQRFIQGLEEASIITRDIF